MLLLAVIAIAASAAQPMLTPFQGPTAAYITAGQDEPGYRNWYMATPAHAIAVTSFNNYLTTYGVGGILPTWQLLRTASSWQRCGAQPYEVPPVAEWPNVVQTLRYVRDYVIPAVGPVEPVSAYRNPALNVCAGGAPESAHKHYSAIDMVPLRPTSREGLMRTLCAVHARRGQPYGVGLGFYAFLRFHVDTTKFRRWGADVGSQTCPPIIHADDYGTVFQPPTPPPTVVTAAPLPVDPPPAIVTAAPPPVDPLAPAPAPPDPPPRP